MLLSAAVSAGDGLPSDLLQFSDDPARTAQLTPLKDAHLDAAAQEVRIWVGFYNIAELKLVRFRIDAVGQVQGESFFVYPPMTGNAEKPYYDQIAGQCQAFNRSEDWEACRPNRAVSVHWDSAYHALQSLGLWDAVVSKLPPASPRNGPTVLVELRTGDTYRAYAFNDPGESKSPPAQKAAKLLVIVDGLVGLKLEQAPDEEEDRD
jgi:hypothetical protein